MIRMYKINEGIVFEKDGGIYFSKTEDWDNCINTKNVYEDLSERMHAFEQKDLSWLSAQQLLSPIVKQEVWAAGVTYLRSKVARMEESAQSGGASFYDKVYEAERPELFFKATAHRVVGPGGSVRIRKDSSWNVPEPELTLVINSAGSIIGYTIGNDMSSRSIEGENPLYLPQAKIYDGSAALGPCILLTREPIPPSTGISMTVRRNGKIIFEGSTTIMQMKRTHNELAGYLFKECSFRDGAYLMTGTCIVPGDDFTLQSSDHILITIDHIGTLENFVE